MALRSKKNSEDINTNRIKIKIGRESETYQDLLSLTVWDSDDKEYSIKALLETILDNNQKINSLIIGMKRYTEFVNNIEGLITSAHDELAYKVTDLESLTQNLEEDEKILKEIQDEITELKNKTKIL